MTDVLATLRASPLRRAFALFALGSLGAVFVYLAIALQTGLAYRLALIAIAVPAFIAFDRMRQASRGTFTVTDDGLWFNDTLLAPMAGIERVEVGMFALKPTNGFAVIMQGKAANTIAPGMYWQFGRRIGVGGVTEPGAAKFMADTLIVLLKERVKS